MSTNNSDNKNYGKQFISGVAILTLSTFIVKIIGLFYKIPMMTYLGADGMGYFNSAYDIYSLFFVISTTGIPVGISILVSESNTQSRYRNAQKIFNISIIILGILGLLGTLLLFLFHSHLAQLISNDLAASSVLAISPALFFICLSSAIRGYFQGNQLMMPTAISQVIEALGKLFLGISFAVIAINKGYSAPIISAYAICGLTLGVILSCLYLVLCKLLFKRKYIEKEQALPTDFNKNIVKKLLTIAIPITISSTILSLTKIIDMTMILGRLNSIGYTQAEANSVYGSYSTMAVSIYNLPSTIISAISLPLVPLIASAIEANDTKKEKSVISSAFKLTALIGLPMGLGIAVFSKPILSLLFSSQSKEIEYIAPLLSLLGLSVFLSSMITVTNAVLQAYKLVNKPIISMIIGTLVKIITSYLLIGNEKINIYGAPVSTFFSVLVIVAINLYFVIKRCGKLASVYSLFVKPFISSCISIVSGIAVYIATSNLLNPKISIIIVILVAAIIYALCILKLKIINKEEIQMLPKGNVIIKILNKIKLI